MWWGRWNNTIWLERRAFGPESIQPQYRNTDRRFWHTWRYSNAHIDLVLLFLNNAVTSVSSNYNSSAFSTAAGNTAVAAGLGKSRRSYEVSLLWVGWFVIDDGSICGPQLLDFYVCLVWPFRAPVGRLSRDESKFHCLACDMGGCQILLYGVRCCSNFLSEGWSGSCGTDVVLAVSSVFVYSVFHLFVRSTGCDNCSFMPEWMSPCWWWADILTLLWSV